MTLMRGILSSALIFAAAVACAPSAMVNTDGSPSTRMSATAPSPDPRINLKPGWFDAGQAIWNLKLVSETKPSANFMSAGNPGEQRLWSSDLAFTGNYVFQGNFSGYQVWDISNPASPSLRTEFVCPGSQSDVSVYRNILFVSSEATNGRVDCGMQGVPDTVSMDRARGIRVFDISDIGKPKLLTTVQTCRGSHTHTVVPDPKDPSNVYVYVSGRANVRSPNELAGCSGASPATDPNTALFRIEVIRVPVAHPEQARIVSSPRIFENLSGQTSHGETPADSLHVAETGPSQCHDITVYPAIGLAGGACGGYGLLLDISDVANPRRIDAVADQNFSFWHSATFNNAGTKILFTDEWGGGTQPRCRSTDKPEWGANAIFTVANGKMKFASYYKLPVAQTATENCVAHNGTLIPIPGRDVMVQAWYQGGLSVFDFTDAAHPKEIAYFDRGPVDAAKLYVGGYWSTYWYNGYIVGSEISRGIDLFKLTPSAYLSQNEINAANAVHFDYLNAQTQTKLVWPASVTVARAYLDQLVRSGGLTGERIDAIRAEISRIDSMHGADRSAGMARLASQLEQDAQHSSDTRKVQLLAGAVREMASTQVGSR
ncbi:MAG: hypothetical protein ABIS03_01380 [Gemmatimonadaceae bacterium]